MSTGERFQKPHTLGTLVCHDEVVAVDGGGDRSGAEAREHELEKRHLRARVLHGNAVCRYILCVHMHVVRER